METNDTAPMVSVILPTYNRSAILGKSIKSVLDQTFQDFELIIVDDGSNDNTADVVKKFEDKRIKYIKKQTNKGAASAMNTGIRTSKGYFVSIQNSDDIWLPEKLETEIKAFQKAGPRVGVVYVGAYRIFNGKKFYVPSPRVKKKEGKIHNQILKGNFVNGLSLIKKDCLEKVGLYDDSLPGLEDWELYIRLSKYYDFKFVDRPLIMAKFSPDSLSIVPSISIDSTKMILKKHFKEFNRNKKALSMNYGLLGYWSFLDGEIKIGRKYYKKAIKLQPFKLQFYPPLIISFFGQKTFNTFLKIFQDMNNKIEDILLR